MKEVDRIMEHVLKVRDMRLLNVAMRLRNAGIVPSNADNREVQRQEDADLYNKARIKNPGWPSIEHISQMIEKDIENS